MKNSRLWIVILALAGAPAGVAGQPLPVTEEIVQVLEARQRANVAPEIVCAMTSLPFPPDQDGYQEIEPRIAPNTYIARFALRPGENRRPEDRRQDIERLDFLASVGFLEARDAVITRGFVETNIPSREYKLTAAGWLAGLGGCLYVGRVEMLRALDYTESAPAPNGFRTIKVRTLMGVRYPPEWARSETARRLFPVIRQQHEGVQREQTLYRDPQGQIDTANTYVGSLKHLHSEEQTRARELRNARLTVAAANTILASIPLKSSRAEGHALPDACLELFPGHTAPAPSLFTRTADGGYTLQLPKSMSGSGAEYAMLYAQARALRLADAGLAALETPRDADAGQLKLRLTPQIEELVAQHGSCLPVGQTKVELTGIGHASDQGPILRPRIYGRSQVVAQAPWTMSTTAALWLPELAVLLRSGVFFEIDVSWRQTQWRVERVRSHAPAWVLPRIDAIGDSPSWRGGYLRQKGISSRTPSVRTHALHVLAAYEGTPIADAGSDKREIEVAVRPMPRPALVVLLGHGRTEWRFHVSPDARYGIVLALGYYPQTVTGLPENWALVSVANILGIAPTYTSLGRVRRIEIAFPRTGHGSTVVTLGRDGPTTTSPGAQIVQRSPTEHIVVPHGVQIIQKGPGEFQIKEFESASSNVVLPAESLARIRDFFGAMPATVNYSYTGSRFVVDGKESLRMDMGEKK